MGKAECIRQKGQYTLFSFAVIQCVVKVTKPDQVYHNEHDHIIKKQFSQTFGRRLICFFQCQGFGRKQFDRNAVCRQENENCDTDISEPGKKMEQVFRKGRTIDLHNGIVLHI